MKTLVAALILSASLSIASLCFAADARKSEGSVVKNSNLPALRGGKVDKPGADLPLCTFGRLVVRIDDERIAGWSNSHPGHVCADSDAVDIVYVCRAGRNLSVRCE